MNAEFIEALNALERERGISKDVLIEAIQTALITAFKRNFSSQQNVRVDVDGETGEVHVYALRTVVESIRQVVEPYTFPVLFDYPSGHIDSNYPLLLSATYQLLVE